MWEEKSIPEHWRWRWLAPIPKVPDPSITDLRPLTLNDALRNVWVGLLINKIQTQWSKIGFIRGTDTALIQTINAIVTAREHGSKICITLWDMRIAFDSLPNQFLIFSWVRLGIPAEVAEYMVNMDMNGYTVVRSPVALNAWYSGGEDELRLRD